MLTSANYRNVSVELSSGASKYNYAMYIQSHTDIFPEDSLKFSDASSWIVGFGLLAAVGRSHDFQLKKHAGYHLRSAP